VGCDPKIKVCHLISGDLWAGAEVQAHHILSTLSVAPELELAAIVLNEGKLAEKLRNCGLPVRVIDESACGFFTILRRVRKYLQDLGIDILHTHRYKENILGALLKKDGTAGHLVQTIHGLHESFKGIRRLKARLYGFLNDYYTRKYFDWIHTVSFDIRDQMKSQFDADRLVTIHNAIPVSEVRPSGRVSEVASELGVEKGRPLVGSVGRMVPVKGYDRFLQAAHRILNTVPEARFVLTGDGPQLPELQNMAVNLGIADKVTFTGFRNDVLDVIDCLDIFVVSSQNEGIPTVVLEAMYLKKAVVAARVGGIPEIIQDDVDGLLVEPDNAAALAAACIRILQDPDLKRRLGEASRMKVNENFNTGVQAERVLQLYREVLRQT
jgi:glycosyltransferase involved in cell wall biosynthesis